MAFNINTFLSNFEKLQGPLPASKFDVQITPRSTSLLNDLGSSNITNAGRTIKLLGYSVDVPGVGNATDLVFLNGYGRINEVPIRPTKSYCDIGFYVDEKMEVYKFLYNWINSTVNIDSNIYRSSTEGRGGAGYNEVYYSESYYCDVKIRLFGNGGEAGNMTEVTLKDAFPIEVAGMNFNWGSVDTVATTSTTLCFRHMEIVSRGGGSFLTGSSSPTRPSI